MLNLKALKEAAEKATPGPWGVWAETTPTKDEAIDELACQVMATPDQDFAGAVYLLDADGKCPATTGCGPTSKENATYIALANPSTILSLIERCEELEGALGTYMFAVSLVNEAMKDGINVHGALSAFVGAEDMARHALSKADATS